MSDLILVVEDNQTNADVLRENLEEEGFELAFADNGALGVALANTALPDLILMDVNLPLLDGLAATTLLKGHSPTAGIPVLALTARAMAGDREECLAAGCDDYLSKPIDMALLVGKMRHYLAQRPQPVVAALQRNRRMPTPAEPVRDLGTDAATVEAERDQLSAELTLMSERAADAFESLTQCRELQVERDDTIGEQQRVIYALRERCRQLEASVSPLSSDIEERHQRELRQAKTRRSSRLSAELANCREQLRAIQAELRAVPQDVQALRARYEHLQEAFMDYHRAVTRSSGEALQHIAFGTRP